MADKLKAGVLRLERKTIDGRGVTLNEEQIKKFKGSAICIGGAAHGCYLREPHRFVTPKGYSEWIIPQSRSEKVQRLKYPLDKDTSKRAYRCRKCHGFMGCSSCAGAIENLVCSNCRDWANDIAEKVHGKMVSSDLASLGFKLVDMVQKGKLDMPGFDKLWSDALKAPPAHVSENPIIDKMIGALAQKMDAREQTLPLAPGKISSEKIKAEEQRHWLLKQQADQLKTPPAQATLPGKNH